MELIGLVIYLISLAFRAIVIILALCDSEE
jgi:hypothetical protein